MTKTPEELAFDYALNILETRILDSIEREEARLGFLAGYQAAKDEYKVAIDAYNDVAKQMLKEAVRIMTPTHEIAKDVLGASNILEKPDGWISVKDRMPPPEVTVLWWNETADEAGVSSYKYMSHCNDTMIEWGDAGYLSIKNFTHWMPLPKPPEEV